MEVFIVFLLGKPWENMGKDRKIMGKSWENIGTSIINGSYTGSIKVWLGDFAANHEADYQRVYGFDLIMKHGAD